MLTSLVGSLRDLPSLPKVFSELKLALGNPNTSIEDVARIVERDIGVSAKLLQLVNSAFFGVARSVTDVKTAVSCLGMTVLQDVVLTLAVFRSFTPNQFLTEDNLQEFHNYAQLTARIASNMSPQSRTDLAIVLSALLHDVGKLVIAERIPGHFARAVTQAQEENKPPYEIEEQLIQISHAEVGAYLLSLWGLPNGVVEAVAHHHHPRRVPHSGVDRILLVYVANILALEREALAKSITPLELDMELLEQNDMVALLPEWRNIAEAADSKQAELVN